MCHFGGPVKGIMQEVEGFDGRFIECLSELRFSNRQRIDVGVCWHAVTLTFYQEIDVL